MNKFIVFTIGVATGSVGTYFAVKKAIEARTDKEIESVVETFKERFDKMEAVLTDEQKEKIGIYSPSKEILKDEPIEKNYPRLTEEKNKTQNYYEEEMRKLGYSTGVDLSEKSDNNAEGITQIGSAPYVITEDEFGEFGNDEETLIFYADGVLATEDDDPIDDIEELIGNCLNEFGEYDERLYVRNQEKEIDYIILRSEKLWSDIAPEVDE